MDADSPSLAPLDADTALLAEVLTTAVRELSGDSGMALWNGLRDAALALREERLEGGRDAFAARVRELDLPQLALAARSFTLWFHLVNAAEEQHRVRVLRQRDRQGARVEGSLQDAVRQLHGAGVDAAQMRALLGRMFIMPVLTAHPTEARRRTILSHLAVISHALDELDRGGLGAQAQARLHEELSDAVLALYGTEESRANKPRPHDEIRAGLDVFEHTLLDVTPTVYRSLEEALARFYPGERFDVPAFLRWGTWIGGDRDGNPFVTAEVTRSALERNRGLVLRRYLADVQLLMGRLSVSSRRVADPRGLRELEEVLERERELLPEVAARAQRYIVHEPWRELLWFVRARLEASIARGDFAYSDAGQFLEDLRLLDRTLRACGFHRLADADLGDVIRRVQVFGFHLATLDLRQHSAVHERVVDELLRAGGVDDYARRDEAGRIILLGELLGRADLRPPVNRAALSPQARDLLSTLDMVGRARREQGPEACERYVISFTSATSDILEVLFLVRAARLSPDELRPVPLLEQLEDLDRAGEIAERMLTLPPIRAAIGGELEVMIGYSDAGKQVGYFASAVALRRAQQALARVAQKHGTLLTIFHGRGGTIGRGGGPANRAIRAQPPEALRGRLRVTEQGETINARYARAEIAERDLEQMVSAVLVASRTERESATPEEDKARNELLVTAAERARDAYRGLLRDEHLLASYAVAATPIQQVAKLPIGSRPASRRPGLSFDDLRAIPWVFSWNQSRHGLPGWFGLGSALEAIVAEHGLDRARELYRDWGFFRALINNAQLSLARADIDVAAHYARLADKEARVIFELIREEYARTVTQVLQVVDRQQLLGNRPHLLLTVKRRNPYVDVLSHAQIELLRRLAKADDEKERNRILSTLFITINGIAAGLQTAG